MNKLSLSCACVAAAGMLCAAATGMAQPTGPRVTQNPYSRSADWPSAGHDWYNTGHNPREQTLTPRTVGDLELVWEHSFSPAPGFQVPVIATAVVAGDTVYIADAAGFMHARKVDGGSLVWTSQVSRALPDPIFGAVIQSGPVVTRDAIFAGDSDASVHKVDRETGDVIWSMDTDSNPLALIQGDLATMGPWVVAGVSSFENALVPTGDLGARGSVVALNRRDGSIGWQTFTTSDQSLPEPKWGAGVGVWSSPAIDPRGGRVFIGSGQFYEPGSEFPSPESVDDEDYSDSLLSLSLWEGGIRDSRQFTEGDVFGVQYPDGPDFDVGIPPTLFSVRQGRRKFAAVGVGDKKGTYYVMDRRDLSLLWSRSVADGSVIGGFQATAAYANGILYVAAHELIDGRSIQSVIPPGQSATWLATQEGFFTVQKLSRTNLMALNANTGEIVWQNDQLGAITFAPLVVAGGVLYQGDANGAVRAFDASTGEVLAQVQVGGFPDDSGGFVVGNWITGLSISRGQLYVSSLGFTPVSPQGVRVYGLPASSSAPARLRSAK